jgi:hypothetical protein
MFDINGMPLKVGDSIQTAQGVCEIVSLVGPDNAAHQGELVRVKTTKGQKTDIRLRLSRAEWIPNTVPTGFKLGDMLARQVRR